MTCILYKKYRDLVVKNGEQPIIQYPARIFITIQFRDMKYMTYALNKYTFMKWYSVPIIKKLQSHTKDGRQWSDHKGNKFKEAKTSRESENKLGVQK